MWTSWLRNDDGDENNDDDHDDDAEQDGSLMSNAEELVLGDVVDTEPRSRTRQVHNPTRVLSARRDTEPSVSRDGRWTLVQADAADMDDD